MKVRCPWYCPVRLYKSASSTSFYAKVLLACKANNALQVSRRKLSSVYISDYKANLSCPDFHGHSSSYFHEEMSALYTFRQFFIGS